MISLKNINVAACAEMSKADFTEHFKQHHGLSSAECSKLYSEVCKAAGKPIKKAPKKKAKSEE